MPDPLPPLGGSYTGLRRSVIDDVTGLPVVTSAPTGDVYQRGAFLPVGRDDAGRLVPAVPQMAFDAIDAARSPGRAWSGNLQIWDPATGHTTDEARSAAGGLAGLALTGSMPFSAPAGGLRTFGGRAAATADHAALAQAEKMAGTGADRRAIWDETGWFTGADGKWRFEIPDDAARMSGPGRASALEEASGGTLGGALDHPALFQAYPDLANAGFFGAHPTVDFNGKFTPVPTRPGGGTLQVSDALGGDRLLGTTLHEVQHGVQTAEGFAPGSTFDAPGYRATAGEVEARNVQARRTMAPEERRVVPPWETQDVPDAQQIVRFGDGPQMSLPMDEASRLARAAEQGYSPQPFYRGEANGKLPDAYLGGGYSSRDREYAAGFAQRGGLDEPREFRLDLSSAYGGGRPFSAPEYARLVESAAQHDPGLARGLTDTIAEGRAPPWVSGFAQHNPDYVLPLTHGEAWPLIERSAAPEQILKGAGYSALDVGGRDVRMLGGRGIRSIDAAFDPARQDQSNIFYAVPTGVGLVGIASEYDRRN